jgi:hypothetical protein
MMAVVPQNQAPNQPPAGDSPDPDDKPVLPQRSPDDSDIGWGDRPDSDDDERLRQERPPHWDDS